MRRENGRLHSHIVVRMYELNILISVGYSSRFFFGFLGQNEERKKYRGADKVLTHRSTKNHQNNKKKRKTGSVISVQTMGPRLTKNVVK